MYQNEEIVTKMKIKKSMQDYIILMKKVLTNQSMVA